MQDEPLMQRSSPRLQLCSVCNLRKQNVINVGADIGNGFGNRPVCEECLPMVFGKKKEKPIGPIESD